MTTTFGDMKRRIAQDLDRQLSRLHGDEIGQAVKDAIKFYCHEHLAFNESNSVNIALATVAATPSYSKPSKLVEVDQMTVTVNNSTYLLRPRTFEWYREQAVDPASSQGQPTDFAIFASQIWIWPTPDAVYDVTVYGTEEFNELSADTDENSWTRATAGELIRAHAKADLYANRLEMPDMAAVQMQVAERHLRRLRESNVARTSSNRVTPTEW